MVRQRPATCLASALLASSWASCWALPGASGCAHAGLLRSLTANQQQLAASASMQHASPRLCAVCVCVRSSRSVRRKTTCMTTQRSSSPQHTGANWRRTRSGRRANGSSTCCCCCCWGGRGLVGPAQWDWRHVLFLTRGCASAPCCQGATTNICCGGLLLPVCACVLQGA